MVDLKGQITELIGRIDLTTLEIVVYSLIPRAAFSGTPNAGDLADNVPRKRIKKLATIRLRLVTRLSQSVHYDHHTGGTKVLQDFWDTL